MREIWTIRNVSGDDEKASRLTGLDPLICRIMINRGIADEESWERYLHPTHDSLHNAELLKNAMKAAELLKRKLDEGSRIAVVGDYDVDGVTSTYIIYKTLTDLGIAEDRVFTRIPNRISDGYGISKGMVDEAIAFGADTIITCDNGVSAFEEIKYAKEQGLTVIVTDHHDIPFHEDESGNMVKEYPAADVFVCENQDSETYPYPKLCGAVTAYKVMDCLYRAYGEKINSDEFLPFLALATVCDVMELADENRAIVKLGLELMTKTEHVGLSALIKTTLENSDGTLPERFNYYHLGFVLGPCINASGRLDDATRALDIFKEKDMSRALEMSRELMELNASRKSMTECEFENAKRILEREDFIEVCGEKVYVIHLRDCHESLAGIVAGKIREYTGHPTIILTGNGTLKGSGRSVEGFHLAKNLSRVQDILIRYGGHELAAGLSIREEKIPEFVRRLNEVEISEEVFCTRLRIDAEVPLGYISKNFIEQLEMINPCGKGNDEPVFARKNMKLLSVKRIGAGGQFLKLKLADPAAGRDIYEAVTFNCTNDIINGVSEKYGADVADSLLRGYCNRDIFFHVIFEPSVNVWQGNESIQYRITHVKF